MRRCVYNMVVSRNCLQQRQQINRYCPLLSLSSANTAVTNHNHLDRSSKKWKSSFSHYQHEKNPRSQSSLATQNDSSSTTIHGTIPLHGKGLKMGQYAQVHRIFTQEDVNLFGRLSGDLNPVHYPAAVTATTATNNDNNTQLLPIVHGILLSSLFSNIFGNLIPGAIYRHQSLKFHNAVHVNECVVGRVVVTKVRQINRRGGGGDNGSDGGGGVLCMCDTSVIKNKKLDYNESNNNNIGDETSCSDNNDYYLDESNSEKEIVCISGVAQVWLPDLQLV